MNLHLDLVRLRHDLVVHDLDALVLALDGRKLQVGGQTLSLQTQNRTMEFREMSKRGKILNTISNPNVAYILMMIGMVGLYFELSNPGLILPGVLGGISLILALYSLQTLPVNYAGLLLILLGIILFIAELNVMSFGLLSIGGAVSFFLGSVMLIDSDDPAMQISRTVLYPTLGFSILVTGGIAYLAFKSRATRAVSGIKAMIGEKAQTKTQLNPEGSVMLRGETWNAHCNDRVEVGEMVIVESFNGLKVKVRKDEEGG